MQIVGLAVCLLAILSVAEGSVQGELISRSGSGRATAYLESPKIITFADRTHVAWLDSDAEGFRVRIRTRNLATGEWTPTWTIGEAANNHGGPALTVDREGYLHVVYYAHHHPVRYRRSVRPNDASEWGPVEYFGENLTYPALVCAEDGSLIFTARRSHDERPWELELWRRAPRDKWRKVGPVVRSRYTGYAQFAASLSWGPGRERLHLATRLYETPNGDTRTPMTTIGYLYSDDGGMTWKRANGDAVELPATAETIERVAAADGTLGRILSGGSMAVDASGRPHIVYSERVQAAGHGYWATPGEGGPWRQQLLNPFLPDALKAYSLHFYGGISFAAGGDALMVGTAMDLAPDDLGWGEPTMEVVLFTAESGTRKIEGHLVRAPDRTVPHWLPNIERETGFNTIPGWPSVVYMEGERGTGLEDALSNRVWWVDLDAPSWRPLNPP